MGPFCEEVSVIEKLAAGTPIRTPAGTDAPLLQYNKVRNLYVRTKSTGSYVLPDMKHAPLLAMPVLATYGVLLQLLQKQSIPVTPPST